MKFSKLLYLVGVLVLTMSMSECSNKNFEQNPPFSVTNAYVQKWMAGVAQGGSGINVVVPITKMEQGVLIDSVFYLGHSAALATKPGDNSTYVGHIVFKPKDDMNMSDQVNGEYGNPVPDVGNNTYELKEDELVVQYRFNGKTMLSKFSGVSKKEQQNYPTMPNLYDGN